MITRRSFLTLLAGVPLIGRYVPQVQRSADAWAPMTYQGKPIYPVGVPDELRFPIGRGPFVDSVVSLDDRILITCGGEVYEFQDDGSFDANRLHKITQAIQAGHLDRL